MPDPNTFVQRFRFKHDRAWSWHIGVTFCVEPKSEATGKRDIYLFFCVGTHDFSMGLLSEPEENEEL